MIAEAIAAGSNLISGFLNRSHASSEAKKQAALQREFAQNGITWKVEDAKRAGIHPLAALGAQTISYAPQAVNGNAFDDIAAAGQNIARGIDATRSNEERGNALAKTMQDLQVQSLSLDNDIKRAELASKMATLRQAGNPPSMPMPDQKYFMDGQGNAPTVDGPKIKLETRRDVSDPRVPHTVPGAGPEVMFIRTPTGGYAPVMPPELAESFESDMIGGWQWYLRNKLAPDAAGMSKPEFPRNGPMEEWVYNPVVGEWQKRARRSYIYAR